MSNMNAHLQLLIRHDEIVLWSILYEIGVPWTIIQIWFFSVVNTLWGLPTSHLNWELFPLPRCLRNIQQDQVLPIMEKGLRSVGHHFLIDSLSKRNFKCYEGIFSTEGNRCELTYQSALEKLNPVSPFIPLFKIGSTDVQIWHTEARSLSWQKYGGSNSRSSVRISVEIQGWEWR